MLNPIIRYLMVLSALLISWGATGNELSSVLDSIRLLDQKTNQLASQFYQQLANDSSNTANRKKSLEALNKSMATVPVQSANFGSLALIHSNLDLINQNFDPTITGKILKHLLDSNDLLTAMSLFRNIESNGDSLLTAKASILLAVYYNSRGQWENTLNVLNIGLDELSEVDASQASLARGIAQQNLKYHRKSIKEYKRVSRGTPFFKSAQTNIAVAHLRQDWWTDAHLIIKELLKPDTNITAEFRDRLNLMLGYSFFNKEYYRESREAFRNVSLESSYTNRAIMGLVLAAIAQQDYASALKTLTLLNQKSGNELVVEESYLLLPNLYQKLHQFSQANLAYQQAIDYYQQRIAQLDLITPAVIENNFQTISSSRDNSIKLADTEFNLTELYPEYFQKDLVLLRHIKSYSPNQGIQLKVEALLSEYRITFESATRKLVERRINALTSYLSQAKYGLAQLYDSADE